MCCNQMIAWQNNCLPWMSRRRHWPTYRCGLVNWRSTCNLLGILQSKDVSDLCNLQKMGNPFAINVGSSDTLAGSARVAKCGEMDSIQVAVRCTSERKLFKLDSSTAVSRAVELLKADSHASVMDIGTVGKCPVVTIKMGGVDGPCLLDTGSQVSTVTESFFRQNIAPGDSELASCHWLKLTAANCSYPIYWVYRAGRGGFWSNHSSERYLGCLRFARRRTTLS